MAYRGPTDIQVTKMSITNGNKSKTVDILALNTELLLYESFKFNTLQGTVLLYDALDLIQELPIIGEETLEVEWRVPDEDKLSKSPPIYGKFYIYKISNRVRDKNSMSQVYVLHFCSIEQYVNLTKKVRRSYKNKPVHEMVKNIHNEFIKQADLSEGAPLLRKTLQIEETKTQQTIVIPNLTPFDSMKFLAERAESGENPSSTYAFWEDHNQIFHFKTIESFLGGECKQTYKLEPANVVYMPDDNTVDDAFNIADITIVKTFDVLDNIQNGMYASEILTHDMILKKYETIQFDYKDTFKSMKHIEKHKLVSNDSKGFTELGFGQKEHASSKIFLPTTMTQPENEYIKSKTEPIDPIRPTFIERFLLKYNSLKTQLNNIVVHITIPGDHERVPGDIINLQIPAPHGLGGGGSTKAPFHEIKIGGKYLVTSVKHKWAYDTYLTQMEIVKDTYGDVAEVGWPTIQRIEKCGG